MTRSFSPKDNGTSAGRTIAVLIISATVLLTGTVFGYAAVSVHGTGSTSANVYGPSLLEGPLTAASVSATTEVATVSAPAASDSMAPLSVASDSMAPLSVASDSMAPLTASSLNGPLK